MANPTNYASILVQTRITGYNEALDWIHLQSDRLFDNLKEASKGDDYYSKGFLTAITAAQEIIHNLTKHLPTNGNS